MKIQTQLFAKEYLNLMMGIFFKRPVFIFFGILGIILLFCFFLGWNIEGTTSTPIYYLLLALFLLVVNPFIFYRAMKKQIYSNPELTEKITYEFTEKQMKLTGETFTVEIPWENIKKIQENKNWFFIQQVQKVMNFIPKSAFGNNLDEFKTLIRKKGF